MKATRLHILSILTLCLLAIAACGDGDALVPRTETQAVFRVQGRAGTGAQEIELLVAERRAEHTDAPGENTEPLHYDYMRSYSAVQSDNASYLVSNLYEQWYKFAFIGLPIAMHEEMFKHPENLDSCNFNDLYIDFTPVLTAQEADQSGTTDYAIYRCVIDRWVKSATTLQENVTLTRTTGELLLDMGIPADQFEKEVKDITLDIPQMHTRLFIRDGGNDSIYLDDSKQACKFSLTISDQSVKQRMRLALLPQELTSARVTVRFDDDSTMDFNLTNESKKSISIKKNTRTTVLFNGLHNEESLREFEIRYAGFNVDALLGVDGDEWDGWQDPADLTLGARDGNGTFIVNFAPEWDETPLSRSISNGLKSKERITSLTYLLYNEGELVKRREIPDINITTWPMRRASMTWEQREALKDTLEVGRNYDVVFVANADKDKCGWAVNPLTGVETYDNASLQMPSEEFRDGTMLYLFKKAVSDAGIYTRDNPCNCPVVLQRVVACTDFVREILPEWTAVEEVKAYLGKKRIETDLMLPVKNKVSEKIKSKLQGFAQGLSAYFNAPPSDATEEVKTAWVGYKTKCDDLATAIGNGTYHQTILVNSTVSSDLETELWNSCLGNTSLKQKWDETWKGKVAKLNYAEDPNFTGSYLGVGKLWLKDWTSATGLQTSASLTVEEVENEQGKKQESFTWVGFGQGGVTDANKVNKISFFEGATEQFSITEELQTNQNGNTRKKYQYIPVKSVKGVTTYAEENYTITYNLEDLLFSGADSDFLNAIKTALSNAPTSLTEYGTDLGAIKLSIQIPDLAVQSNLIIESKWEEVAP